MSPVEIVVVDQMYFTARAACGHSWPGMRNTDDVRIVVNRAMDHEQCDERPCGCRTEARVFIPCADHQTEAL